jgi:hypothetical protein
MNRVGIADPRNPRRQVDRTAGLVPAGIEAGVGDRLGRRVQHLRPRQFGQQDAGQGVADAVNAQQQVASGPQVRITVDRPGNGLVCRSQLGAEGLDHGIGQGARGWFGDTAVPAVDPFPLPGGEAGPHGLQLAQPA